MWKNLQLWKLGRKSQKFFILEFEIMQCNGVITKNEQRSLFKLVSVKNVKTACVCNVFFFYYFKNFGQNFFSRITLSYLIAKVGRKE